MVEWILTGFLLFRLWTPRVGVWNAVRGCAWVIVRKALPDQKTLAKNVMPRPRTLELKIPGHAHPFYARWPASDLHIVYTILTRKEYAPIATYLDKAGEIVFLDLGANIGAASRYFLETFPRSRVIAVEPDAGNIAMCHMNLDPYGDRVRVLQAAAWNRNTRLIFEEGSNETGVEAGVQVREPLPGDDPGTSVEAIDIPTLLSQARISTDTQVALKIDIEGSEQEIFGASSLDWLDQVTCIAIELHDYSRKNCSRNFYSAIEGHVTEPPSKIGDTVFAHTKARLQVVTSG
ncbi:MAG TPA: FkbM family methyltransferase [Terracidiphilus sp.]|nr:FkbM family methyltransferase [Terracidiphilus sp.]